MKSKLILLLFLTSIPIFGFDYPDTLQNHPDTLTFVDDPLVFTGNIGALAYQIHLPDTVNSFEIAEILFCFTLL